MEGGRKVGGRRESSWRREIVRIRDGVGVLAGGWFEKCILKKVGDVSDTLFCSDPWLDGGLCVRGWLKGRLYSGRLKGGHGCGRGSCGHGRRRCWGSPDPANDYSIRGAYQFLTSQDSVTLDASHDLIWHKQVPLKACLTNI
ncbi:hypothetical protein TSUD_189280 [Trifolium subterraneum]|uniref:Uncharacterized protein n=1 Tax=Trifolium subterraneum TaxID=3900 RepID=A0A2Z6MDZ2_TRISU|nr:hypothetical protein TSUD_189280 [Trifolium subterraneum]